MSASVMRDVPARALSIMQPWAHAIVHLGKTIENRDWRNGCSYRGEILLHASKSLGAADAFDLSCRSVRDAVDDELRWGDFRDRFLDLDLKARWRPRTDLRCGGIVGKARIVGEVFADQTGRGAVCEGFRRGERTRWLTPAEERWWTGDFALVLADVEPLPFVPYRGALGLWMPPEDLRRAIARAA